MKENKKKNIKNNQINIDYKKEAQNLVNLHKEWYKLDDIRLNASSKEDYDTEAEIDEEMYGIEEEIESYETNPIFNNKKFNSYYHKLFSEQIEGKKSTNKKQTKKNTLKSLFDMPKQSKRGK